MKRMFIPSLFFMTVLVFCSNFSVQAEECSEDTLPISYENEETVLEESYSDSMEYFEGILDASSAIVLERDLQNGISGNDVKMVQERLIELGYDVGPADGIFGAVTEGAVLTFQKEYGLYEDGVIGVISIEVINSIQEEYAPLPYEGPMNVSAVNRDLSFGSLGDDVYAVQELLQSLGYTVGALDGVFGNITRAAVLEFQNDHQLYVDGIIGPQTAAKLHEYAENIQQKPTDQAELQPEPTDQPGTNDTGGRITVYTDSDMPGSISLSRNLSIGMTGGDVSLIQQRLFDLGYLDFRPDKDFGPVTEAAVKQFQKDHNIYVDGLVGPQTLQYLNLKHFLEEPVVSDLTEYTSITEKCYSRNGEPLRFIIPHHMAGRMTGEACADYFTYNTAGTSANYCIGYGGDIALNVPEQYGAWTSGNTNFDRQAVTIEVSDTANNDWRIPQAAQESLMDLCVDLLQRYPSLGGKLVYDIEDEERVIAVKKGYGSWDDIRGNVLLHCWTTTSGTTCPEWHMKEILPSLIDQINLRVQQTQ